MALSARDGFTPQRRPLRLRLFVRPLLRLLLLLLFLHLTVLREGVPDGQTLPTKPDKVVLFTKRRNQLFLAFESSPVLFLVLTALWTASGRQAGKQTRHQAETHELAIYQWLAFSSYHRLKISLISYTLKALSGELSNTVPVIYMSSTGTQGRSVHLTDTNLYGTSQQHCFAC